MKLKRFKRKIKELEATKDQKKIINSNLSVCVTAGAGSGKTKVLVDKIIQMLENEDIELDDLAIITFTNKAAVEMKDRLRKMLYFKWLQFEEEPYHPELKKSKEFWRKQVEECEMVDISTIHKFCEKIIRKFGLTINLPINFKVKSVKDFLNRQSKEIVGKYIEDEELSEVKSYILEDFLKKFFIDNENKGLEFDDKFIKELKLDNKKGKDWEKILELFLDMYMRLLSNLEEYKKENNILTTNDLIKYAVKILEENEYSLAKIAKRYKAIFIDESQDTNQYQYKLIKKLKKKGIGIFLVGDEKQSIYRFRGADVESFKEIISTRDLIEIKKNLADNFRTDKRLLELINKIFEHDFKDDENNLLMIGSNNEYEGLNSKKSKNKSRNYKNCFRVVFNNELEKTIKTLKNKEGIKYKDIVVLFRGNFDLNQCAQKLKETDIPIEVIGGEAFYSSKVVIDLFKIFNYILHSNGSSYFELRYTDYYKAYKKFNNAEFDDFLKENLYKRFRFLSVDNLIEYIYSETRIREYYKEEKLFQDLANLEKLKDLAMNITDKEFIQPIEFCNYLDLMIETGKEEEEGEVSEKFKKDDGIVSLISIHKAKGLEYPVVIIPKIDKELNKSSLEPKIIFDYDKRRIAFNASKFYDEWNQDYLDVNKDLDYELLNKDDKKERLEEELRILYVALTRAENMLILLGDEEPEDDEICWANWLKEVRIDGESLLDKYRFNFR